MTADAIRVKRHERASIVVWFLAISLGALLFALAGCTTIRVPIGGTPVQTNTYLTGNWVFQLTSTSGPFPIASLGGFIYAQQPGVDDATTASLEATVSNSSTCYLGADLIPLYGTVSAAGGNTTLSIHSLPVDGQTLTIQNAVANGALTTLSGTYTIAGGCSNGAAGKITGQRYANLTGTYSGAIAAAMGETISLDLTQDPVVDGTGSGTFLVSGSATIGGISCFKTGSIPTPSTSVPGSTIIGNQVSLTFADSDGSLMTLTGTINPAASTLALTSVTVTGGSCAGSLGSATLTVAS